MFYDLKCLYLVSCQTLLPFVYSSFELNVCLLDWLGNMWISCLCLYSSPNLSLQNQSELVLRDSPQFSYKRSLCLTVLHLHCEFLGTPCVDPFCRKPLLNTDIFGVSSLLNVQISTTFWCQKWDRTTGRIWTRCLWLSDLLGKKVSNLNLPIRTGEMQGPRPEPGSSQRCDLSGEDLRFQVYLYLYLSS